MARGEAHENYLSKQVKMGSEQQTTIPENHHMQILDSVLFCLLHNFRVVKQENKVHHVKLGIFPPQIHIKFIKFGATVI